MKTLPRTLAALGLAACSLAAQAQTLHVAMAGNFELPPITVQRARAG